MARPSGGKREIDSPVPIPRKTRLIRVSQFREFCLTKRIPPLEEDCQMKNKILFVFALCVFGITPAFAQYSPTITVNCALGQSLNATLSRLFKQVPVTVFVQGTCTEYITINGFTGLTLKGLPGAALKQPTTNPGNGVPVYVLLIEASQSITIDGLPIHSRPSALGGVAVGRNSIDVKLRNLTVDGGGTFGFFIYEGSQVSLARVTGRDPGYALVGVFDLSDVHIESSLFENSTGASSQVGFEVDTGHITVQSTTIRNMQVGININVKGDVDIQGFNSYYPISLPNDVVIENPADTNYQGVKLAAGSHLNLGDTKLRITNSGQPWGGNSAAVWISDGSTLSDQSGNLIISGSQGQGIFVSNNSHATLIGSRVTGGGHGGLVVANLSSVSIGPGNQTLFGGNVTDVFCDSRSLITGGANFAGVPITNCGNVLAGDTEPLP
jgi:hypothetical protein